MCILITFIKHSLAKLVNHSIREQPRLEGTFWKTIWVRLSWEGESRWDYLASCSHLEIFQRWGFPHVPGEVAAVNSHLTVIFSHVKMKRLPHCSHLVFSMWILMEKEPPSSLWLSFKYWNSVMSSQLSLLFSREKSPTPSVFPHRAGSLALWSPLMAFFGPLHSVHIFLGS